MDDEILGESEPEKSTNEKKNWIKLSLIIGIIIILIIVIIIILMFTVLKKEEEDKDNQIIDDKTILDTIPKEELDKARNSFNQSSFIDTVDTSKIINYNIFLPKNYTKEKKYPLIVFIGDLSTLGNDTKIPITQTVGGPIWATETVQKNHECIVLVPEYNEVLIDDRFGNYSKSEYINVTVRLINELKSKYSIDSDRIYGTGQSMGAMTTLYLLSNNQDLFAAGLIVDGNWLIDELLGLVNSTFVYFAAGGDTKCVDGQNEIKNLLTSNNIKYGSLEEINAQEKIEILNEKANEMLNQGNKQNFITYAKGTVTPPGSSYQNEHMASFKYGFRIDAVRDWIFSQKKVNNLR